MTTPQPEQTDDIIKQFNDTFEAEIEAQEFAIDEAEWAGLLKALKVSQVSLKAALNRQALATALRLIGDDHEWNDFADPGDAYVRNEHKAELRQAFTDYYGGGE